MRPLKRASSAVVGSGESKHKFGRNQESRQRASRATENSVGWVVEAMEPRVLLSAVSWTGAQKDGLWSNPLNWTGGSGIPTSADDVTIGGGFPTISVASGIQAVYSLTSSSPLRVSGGTLDVAAASSFSNSFTLSGGVLQGSGDLTLTGTLNWSAGAMQGSGKTIIAATGTLILSGGTHQLNRVLENDGAATWSGGSLAMSNGTVNNNSSWTANSALLLQGYGSAGPAMNAFNNNAGATFTKSGAGPTQFTSNASGVAFNNAGTVNTTSGELDLLSGGSQTGAFTSATGATLGFGGGHTFSNTSTITGDGNLTAIGGTSTFVNSISTAGNVTFQGGSFTIVGPVTAGTLNFNGGTAVLNGDTSAGGGTILSGTLDGSATITYSGAVTWYGGTMQGSGTTIIAATATLTLADFTHQLNRILENDGTTTWTSGALVMTNGTVNNNSNWIANGTELLQSYSNTGSTINAFNNNAGAAFTQYGTTRFFDTGTDAGVTFNNRGIVNINASGDLEMLFGGTQTGAFNVPAGARLGLGGIGTFMASSALSVAGTLAVAAGTTGFDAPLSVTGQIFLFGGIASFDADAAVESLKMAGGTLDGSATVTVIGAASFEGGTMQGSGETVIAPGATLSMIITSTLARVLENDGAATWTSGSLLMSNGTVNNNGTWTASSNVYELFCYTNDSSTTNAFNNNAGATFIQSGTSITTFVYSVGVAFNNSGTVNVTAGMLQLGANGTNSNVINVSSGATLNFSGDYTDAVGSSLNGVGSLLLGGIETFAGTISIACPTTLTGTIAGPGNVTFTRSLDCAAGSMTAGGKTVVAPAATMTLDGIVTLGRILENDGTVSWNSGTLLMDNGTVNNNATWSASVPGNLQSYSDTISTNAFDNNAGATFNQSGSGTTQFLLRTSGVAFNNSGSVIISAGALEIGGGGTNRAVMKVSSTYAILNFSGDYSHAVGSTLLGSGNFEFGGVETFAGAMTISGGAALTGTFTGPGNLTFTNILFWDAGRMDPGGRTIIAAGAGLNVEGNVTLARILENDGGTSWDTGTFLMDGGTVFNEGHWTDTNSASIESFSNTATINTFYNVGSFTQSGPGTASFDTAASPVIFNNIGSVNLYGGTLQLVNIENAPNLVDGTLKGGFWNAFSSGRLILPGSITNLAAQVYIDGANSLITDSGGTANAFSALSTISNGGSISLQSGRSMSITPAGGLLTNDGTITLGVGDHLMVNGAFKQATDGTYTTQLSGPTTASFGQLAATGTATLGGALRVTLGAGYDPAAGLSFAVVTGISVVGTFSTFIGRATPSGRPLTLGYTATTATITINPAAPNLTSTVIGDGTVQRSVFNSLTLNFDQAMNLAAGAFTMNKVTTGGTVSTDPHPILASTDVTAGLTFTKVGDGHQWVISVTPGGSLDNGYGDFIDGVFQYTLHSALITNATNQALAGGDQTASYLKRYGDIDGDGVVGNIDFGRFRQTFGKSLGTSGYNAGFDIDHDNIVGNIDFGRFKANFGKQQGFLPS